VISVVVAMIVILAVAAAIIALVLVGIEGRGWHWSPNLARRLRRAAFDLNGDRSRPTR
jgi:hypothetical protein